MANYDSIASVYDNINSEIDYSAWADFIENCFTRYLSAKRRSWCLTLGVVRAK